MFKNLAYYKFGIFSCIDEIIPICKKSKSLKTTIPNYKMTEYIIGKAPYCGDYDKRLKKCSLEEAGRQWSRLVAKNSLLEHCSSIIDHKWFYSCRKKGSRGPAKETEGFLIAYPYHVDEKGEKQLSDFCERAELKYLIEPHPFRVRQDAFRVIIYDKDVNLEFVLSQAERLREEREVILKKPIWEHLKRR